MFWSSHPLRPYVDQVWSKVGKSRLNDSIILYDKLEIKIKKVTYYLSIQSLYNSNSKKLHKPINKPRFFLKDGLP